jgi:hypothetical protein
MATGQTAQLAGPDTWLSIHCVRSQTRPHQQRPARPHSSSQLPLSLFSSGHQAGELCADAEAVHIPVHAPVNTCAKRLRQQCCWAARCGAAARAGADGGERGPEIESSPVSVRFLSGFLSGFFVGVRVKARVAWCGAAAQAEELMEVRGRRCGPGGDLIEGGAMKYSGRDASGGESNAAGAWND